jgi:cystatin-related protein
MEMKMNNFYIYLFHDYFFFFFFVCVQDDEKIPRLEFVKVLRAMKGGCAGSRFFITFEAKEEDSAGGQTKTYQTVVSKPPARKPVRVLSFRECEVEQGNYDQGNFI